MSSLIQNAYAMIRILDEIDLYNFNRQLYSSYVRGEVLEKTNATEMNLLHRLGQCTLKK